MAVLAYCTATALRPNLAPNDGEDLSAYDIALSLTGANVADTWRPSKANYLSRLAREQPRDRCGDARQGMGGACGGFKRGGSWMSSMRRSRRQRSMVSRPSRSRS